MKISNVTESDLMFALVKTNKKFDDNVAFKTMESMNKERTRWNVTLRVMDSRGKGARRGFPVFKGFNEAPGWEKRRHLPSACWHVHGVFFDCLLSINENAVIVTSGSLANPLPSNKITKDGGNWQDWNIGARLNPYWMSEACDCE